ncbi:MAG TPA: AAA family ATPase, partial [Candidatus Limnocylindrales bacterium]|nr:AAA family ATPase [Candidatus Limnocylindrales bacterium]
MATATLTLLFTDIEGSTRLLQELGDGYGAVLDRQRRLLDEAVRRHGGNVFGSEGDALFATFERASGALAAAADAQRALANEPWPDGRRLRVRMGIHTGVVSRLRDDYVGLPLHQAARITAAGHGGQVLVSAATAVLVRDQLADLRLRLRDLGQHRLKDLPRPEPLAQLEGDGLEGAFPALRAVESRPGNLPVQLTSFVGRAEIAAAAALLATTRLLTLVGPGGTGKTRLALQLATEAGSAYPDGTYFVGLDAVVDPELVPPEILAALDVPDGAGSALDRLADHLRDRRLLLVLDNLEQVVAAGPAIARLLRDAPGLRIVATSRIPLRISGEQEFAVPPLGVPPAGAAVNDAGAALRFEAVRLFVERATAVAPAFAIDDANAATVVDIVRRLDGLPLAIELAAARVRVLPIDALHARLDRALGILVGGARDLPARQQTLRGAIDWSYDLLDEPDRRLFARFAVVAGAARLSEIDAICGPAQELGRDVLDGLTSLADGSLLRAELAVDEEPRFGMLVTIREYASERLAERGEAEHELVRRRHAETYLAVADGCRSRLTGREGRRWLDRLEADHDNFRAAVDWAVEIGDAALAVRLLDALWRFWQFRGHLVEAAMRADRILALSGVADLPPDLVAAGFGAAGSIAYWRADHVVTNRSYTRALDAARRSGRPALIAEALYNLGFSPIEDESTPEARYIAGRPLF